MINARYEGQFAPPSTELELPRTHREARATCGSRNSLTFSLRDAGMRSSSVVSRMMSTMEPPVSHRTDAFPKLGRLVSRLTSWAFSGRNTLLRYRFLRRNSARVALQPGLFFLLLGAHTAFCQVSYSVSVEMEKPRYLLGEPIFCRFVIRNMGRSVFAFRYRSPTRSLTTDYNQEPRFLVTDSSGRRLPDPGPRPCGGGPP